MHTHTEHRKRVRDRFLQEGLDHFDPVHALELLLFYAVPRVDTKPIARALLDRFDSFHGVLEADVEQLQQVSGVGKNVAVYLKLLCQTGRYYNKDKDNAVRVFNYVEEYGEYLAHCYEGLTNETVFLLCMDAKCRMLGCKLLGEGDAVSTNLPVRRLVEAAVNAKATMVVLAHNHPSGVAIPSPEDVATTDRLRQALDMLHIQLVDHVIVANGDYVSMAQSGYFG